MESNTLDLASVITNSRELLTYWGLRVAAAAALLVGGWVFAAAVRRSLRRLFQRTELDQTLEIFVTSLVYWATLIFVGLAVLGVFGIETTSIVAVLGAGSFAVGLALQGTLSNFASGVMLLVFRPFKVGDFIEAGGVSGTVEEVGIFSSSLNTSDNIRVVAPNSLIYGKTVKNYSINPTRRLDLTVGISYTDDIGEAIRFLERTLADDDRVLAEPAPRVVVSELADSSVNLLARPWCRRQDYWSLRCDLHRRVKEGLEAAGCSIPYPQTDIHLHQVDVLG